MVAFHVRDVEAAAAFYELQLGLCRLLHAPAGTVVFDASPVRLGLRPPAPGMDMDGATTGFGVALWLAAEGAQALHDRLVAYGVTIVRPPFAGQFGLTFVFRDPDGYAITIHDAQ